MAADRSLFVDQGISLNAHISDVTSKKLTALHLTAWKLSLNTGMYYLRTQAASEAGTVLVSREIINKSNNNDNKGRRRKNRKKTLHELQWLNSLFRLCSCLLSFTSFPLSLSFFFFFFLPLFLALRPKEMQSTLRNKKKKKKKRRKTAHREKIFINGSDIFKCEIRVFLCLGSPIDLVLSMLSVSDDKKNLRKDGDEGGDRNNAYQSHQP